LTLRPWCALGAFGGRRWVPLVAVGARRCSSVPVTGAFGAFGAFGACAFGACASWCVTVPVPAWPFRCDFLVNQSALRGECS